MIDIAAIKARLSDPREVAGLLGLRINQRGARGVRVKCPLHAGDSPLSLSLRIGNDGTLQVRCFAGCLGAGGDVLTLLAALEGDFKRGLARAIELAGGSVGAPAQAWQEPPRMDPDAYHELAKRILAAGRLDGRPWVWEVEAYLGSRRLLEQAREDGWACLPRFEALPGHEDELLEAGLAKHNDDGKVVPFFGRWRLVIPWRGPDGRISALQRRRTWEHDGNGPEPVKYVFPRWRPDWPYGSDRLCIGLDRKEIGYVENREGQDGIAGKARAGQDSAAMVPRIPAVRGQGPSALAGVALHSTRTIAICEGAVDTLALRSLYPRLLVLGIPGIDGWRAEWAGLAGDSPRVALDRGKDKGLIIPEDRAAARIALDCAGRGQERDDVIEWLTRRFRQGKSLFCVLCGAAEPWLCGACGRRRAKGKDWGEEWVAKVSALVWLPFR